VTFSSGTFTGYRAAAGWDPVTGWGTPDARELIALLVRDVTHPATPEAQPAGAHGIQDHHER
jgi:hypothetical protein